MRAVSYSEGERHAIQDEVSTLYRLPPRRARRAVRRAPHFNTCERCHSLERFLPSTFSLRRHNETPFGLTGSHVAVPCGDCHKPSPSVNLKPKPAALYHWPNLACTSCHADPHRGRFQPIMLQLGLNRKPHGVRGLPLGGVMERLLAVRPFEDWFSSERRPRDHEVRGLPSIAKVTGVPTSANFKAAPVKCEACHSDVHAMQFSKAGVTDCASCHDSTKWNPSTFDHDKQTTFALQGAHRDVRCEACHKSTRMVNAKAVLFYRPTPRAARRATYATSKTRVSRN